MLNSLRHAWPWVLLAIVLGVVGVAALGWWAGSLIAALLFVGFLTQGF